MRVQVFDDTVIVTEAENMEQFSTQLLQNADPRRLNVDGDLITITADNARLVLFDAAALMAQNPEASGSVYTAERGLLVFG